MVYLLHLFLADSELEKIPSKIASHPLIKKESQKRKKETENLILDSNYHHEPMNKLEDSNRRGRPDIVHVCMLLALDSPLNREGFLRFYVHTRNDELINIDPQTRIPRSYNRFIGLMEQLFAEKTVPPDSDPLMKIEEKPLETKIKEIEPRKTITFSEKGKKLGSDKIFEKIGKNDDLAVIIGGFPHGDFLSDVGEISDEILKIYRKPLDAVSVVCRTITCFEETHINLELFSKES